MGGAVEEYLFSRAEFIRINGQILDLMDQLIDVATAIRRKPGRFIFANTSAGLPMEASMSKDSKSSNGQEWPTAEGIQGLLAEWHLVRGMMLTGWAAIQDQIRSGLQPPPPTD